LVRFSTLDVEKRALEGGKRQIAIDPNKWTVKTQEAVAAAVDLARRESHPELTPTHLLAALVGQEDGVVLPTLERAGAAPASAPARRRPTSAPSWRPTSTPSPRPTAAASPG
jgi:ATP-dependent Clp protease ATP-binding subunit ClpA